jgi:hypothetical protein
MKDWATLPLRAGATPLELTLEGRGPIASRRRRTTLGWFWDGRPQRGFSLRDWVRFGS